MSSPLLSERNSVRVAVALLALTMYAVMFDQWWHKVFSRDSLVIPPHYFVYGISGALVLFSWYTWRAHRKQEWRKFGKLMTILPISAPFDSFWHAWFGLENQNSVWVAWSPPHVILAFMFMFAQYRMFRLVQEYETDTEAKKLLSLLCIALFFSSTTFLLLPLQPLYYFHELGLYGFIMTLPVMVSFLLFARRHFGFAAATILSLFFYSRVFAGAGESFAAYVSFTPVWVSGAPPLLAALALDALPRGESVFKQALTYGVTLSVARTGAFFLFSIGLFKEMHVTLTLDYLLMTVTTLIGCMLGAVLLYYGERLYTRYLFGRSH